MTTHTTTKKEKRTTPRFIPTPQEVAESRERVDRVIRESQKKKYDTDLTKELFEKMLRKVSQPIQPQSDSEKTGT